MTTSTCPGIVPTPDGDKVCGLFLEAGYAPVHCPSCLARIVLTEAVAAAKWDVRYEGTAYVVESLTTAATTADLVLAEDADTLGRFPARAVSAA